MKTLIFICILAVVAADLNAQIEKISKVLEPAVLECRYQCIQKLDTLGVTSVTDTMIPVSYTHLPYNMERYRVDNRSVADSSARTLLQNKTDC